MIALALLALLAAPAAGPSRPAPRELWVQVGGAAAGDGSRARPLARLEAALARRGPLRIHLGPGRYAGPFRLPAGTELVADGEVVLHGPPEAPVVLAPSGARLVGLVLEGGSWGLRGSGVLALERVRVRDGARGGVRWDGGSVTASGLALFAEAAPGAPAPDTAVPGTGRAQGAGASPAPVPGTVAPPPEGSVGAVAPGAGRAGAAERPAAPGPASAALSLGRGVRVQVQGLQVRGAGWPRALDLEGAEGRLDGVLLQGVRAGLRQRGGRVALHGLRAGEGAGGAAVLVTGGGRLSLEDAQVTGFDYALLARDGAKVEVRGLTSLGAASAGLALVASEGRLRGVRVERAGLYGAVQLVGSRVTLEHYRLVGSRDVALSAVGGRLVARHGRVEGVGGDGTAVMVHGADAELAGLEVGGAAVGVLAGSQAHLRVRGVHLLAPTEAGLLSERGARLDVAGLRVEGQGAPAVVALSGARLVLADVALDAGAEAGWLALECARGAGARLVRTPPPPPEARACAVPGP